MRIDENVPISSEYYINSLMQALATIPGLNPVEYIDQLLKYETDTTTILLVASKLVSIICNDTRVHRDMDTSYQFIIDKWISYKIDLLCLYKLILRKLMNYNPLAPIEYGNPYEVNRSVFNFVELFDIITNPLIHTNNGNLDTNKFDEYISNVISTLVNYDTSDLAKDFPEDIIYYDSRYECVNEYDGGPLLNVSLIQHNQDNEITDYGLAEFMSFMFCYWILFEHGLIEPIYRLQIITGGDSFVYI